MQACHMASSPQITEACLLLGTMVPAITEQNLNQDLAEMAIQDHLFLRNCPAISLEVHTDLILKLMRCILSILLIVCMYFSRFLSRLCGV